MQNAKDTFYEVLRSRLVALNPERTIVLRGVMRPGVLVEENELAVGSGATRLLSLAMVGERRSMQTA